MEVKSFEDALQQLEQVVAKLDGDISLDDAVKEFEKGVELSKVCMQSLKEEKGKLQLLIDDINNLTQDFKVE